MQLSRLLDAEVTEMCASCRGLCCSTDCRQFQLHREKEITLPTKINYKHLLVGFDLAFTGRTQLQALPQPVFK